MGHRHGLPGHVERTASVLLPSEEVLVEGDRRKPCGPSRSNAVRLIAGPCHLADGTKPLRPGVSVLKNGKNFGGRSIQFHDVLETHGRSVKERGIHRTTRKAHGSASQAMCGKTGGGTHSPSFVAVRVWLNIAAVAMQFRPFERRLRSRKVPISYVSRTVY